MTKPLRLNLQMFGASASKSKSLYSSGYPSSYPYTLSASLVENSTDTINNTSSVTITATLQANGQYWTTSYNSTLAIYWYDNRTGTETLKNSITFAGLSGKYDTKSVSSTFNVQHNNDGSLNGYAHAYFTKGSTTSINACSSGDIATDLVALTSIPRVSGVSCSNVNVGGTATIYIARADSTYTDTLTYTIGSLTGTIATRTNQASVPFDTSSMKDAIYQQMSTSSQTIQGTIGIQTFNSGGTSVGTNSTTFTLTAVAEDCKPLITIDLTTTDQLSYDLTGNNTTVIKGQSETSIAYTITPRQGASIMTTMAYNYSDNLPPSPITSFNIVTNNFTIRAVDTRFFPNQVTAIYSFVDYFVPTINFEAYRTSPTGSEIKGKFTGSFFNDNFGVEDNTLTLQVKYKLKGASTWTALRTLVEDTDYTIDDNNFYSGTGSSASDITLDSSVFNYQNAYDVAIFYNDEIISSSYELQISKGVPVMNWEDELVNINGSLTISDANGDNPVNVLTAINTNTSAINNINSGLTTLTYADKTNLQTTDGVRLFTTTLNKGIYLIQATIPINFYGMSGRDIALTLFLNNNVVCQLGTIINIYAYTITRQMTKIINVTSNNSTLAMNIGSSSVSRYDVYAGSMDILKLK